MFEIFFTFFKIPFLKKNWGYNRATVTSITRKILACDMKSWYKNVCKIRNVTFIFQNFQNTFQKRKKNSKQLKWSLKNQWIHLKCKKVRSPDYSRDNYFFYNFFITFRHYYYAKYVFDFFNMIVYFFIFFISRITESLIVLNFWLAVYTKSIFKERT